MRKGNEYEDRKKVFFCGCKRCVISLNQIKKNRNQHEKKNSNYHKNIVKASQNHLENETMKVVEGIPIEELNRDKRGIRVKLLRTHGYNNYVDVYYASVHSLSEIKGISEEKALLIKNIVVETKNATQEGMHLKLNVDHKTPETTEIMINTIKLKNNKSLCQEFNKIYDENLQKREEALDNLKVAKGFFRWLFTSSSGKKAAIM